MAQLSVIIITFNEERNIARCLDSVKCIADDIVVVDSFSTDNTKKICLEKGARVFDVEWLGYSAQKNYANSLAKYDYIFSIDADEAVSEQLAYSIKQLKEKDEYSLARLNRLTNYCGKWIHYSGWYPDAKIRFFDRRLHKWEGAIHEKLNTENKKVVQLKGDLLHYSYYTREQHLLQIQKFSDIAAKSMYEKGKKASVLKLIFKPISRFLRNYFFKLGFLDGVSGFVICRLSAYSIFLRYKKLNTYYK